MKRSLHNRSDRIGKRLCHGFTLVEMLIVVALTALVMLFSIPNVIARLPVYRLDSATDRISSQLHVARMEAMTEGQFMGVRFEGPAKTFNIWPTAQNNGPAGEEVQLFNLQDLRGVNFQTYPSQGYFGPNGAFTSGENSVAGGTLWVWVYSNDTKEQRSIVIWPSGQVSVFKYTGG
jgi:prepilin-type N-terminal cleavage/methylation domain-containing protein